MRVKPNTKGRDKIENAALAALTDLSRLTGARLLVEIFSKQQIRDDGFSGFRQ